VYQYLIKNGFKLAVYLASGIVIIFLILAIFTGAKVDMESGDYDKVSQFNFGLIMGIICLFAIVGLSSFFTLRSIVANKASKSYLRKLSIGLGIIFIILAIMLRSSSSASLGQLFSDFHISPMINGLISSGIILSILIAVLALGLIIYLELKNIYKA
jgi:hypothetical protein